MKPTPREPKLKIRWLAYVVVIAVVLIMSGPVGLAVGIAVCVAAEIA